MMKKKETRLTIKDELAENSTIGNFPIVQKEGERKVKRGVNLYDLDTILSVGYRVNSRQATQFRIWATNVLKKHLVDGYTINEKRLRTSEHKYQRLCLSVFYAT